MIADKGKVNTDVAAEIISMLLCVSSVLPWIIFSWRWGGLFDSFFSIIVVPTIPWFVLLGLLFLYKTKPLRSYWWGPSSAVICLPLLIIDGFIFLCWGIGGFAP